MSKEIEKIFSSYKTIKDSNCEETNPSFDAFEDWLNEDINK